MPDDTKPLRVAVVVPKYGLIGGGEKFVFEVTERLAGMDDLEIHVLANRWRAASDRVRFHRIPILRFPRFATALSFAANVRR